LLGKLPKHVVTKSPRQRWGGLHGVVGHP
jgi:hypothetical protein